MPKVIGEGVIEEKVRGKIYYIRHSLGKDPTTGRYIRSPRRTVYGNKAEARRQLELYRIELEQGFANLEKVTLAEYADKWLERRQKADTLSPLTVKRDGQHVRKIKELLGSYLINEVTTATVNAAYDTLRKEGRTASYIHNVNGALSLVMKSAVREGLIPYNPCDNVDAPRQKRRERHALSLEQAVRLASDLRSEKRNGHIVAVWLALATGVRRGEALGLMWKDVDFRRKRIFVGQQWAHDKKLRAPKSEKSMRWIGIDDGTVLFLKEWKAQQAREMEIQGMDQSRETPVCTSSTYGLIDPNSFSRWRRQFFVEHGLGRYEEVTQYMPNVGCDVTRQAYVGFNFHELRHTQATLLIGKGADIKTVQHRLGHSSASLTMDVYAHAIPSNDEAAAEMVGDMLSGRSAEATPRPAAPAPQTVPAQPAAPAPAPQGDGSIGVSKELIGTLLAQLPPEKLVEMLKSAV